jgi:hypothetical protein
MLKNSQVLRFAMAAGMYLLVMWGYSVLPNGQWFAAFLALIMCSMLIFWVSDTAADVESTVSSRNTAGTGIVADTGISSGTCTGNCLQSQHLSLVDHDGTLTKNDARTPDSTTPITSLEASVLRLDSLKTELMLQYAQFGRDQSLLNSNGLGSWHGNRKPGAR